MDPDPDRPRGSGRSGALLIVVAVIVALGAGGGAYALMHGDGDNEASSGIRSSSATAPPAPAPTVDEPSPSGSPSSSPSDAPGAIPEKFLGTWDGVIDTAAGHSTRTLVIEQGKVGDTVLSLTADGPTGAGGYHCVFRAPLAEKSGDGDPLKLGPSTVSVGEPASSCSPGAASTVTVRGDGKLQRTNDDTGEKLTYTKAD